MHKGIAVVKPAIQALEAVHQALGRISEVRLTVAEFIVIDSGQERLFADPLIREPAQGSLHHRQKLAFLFL